MNARAPLFVHGCAASGQSKHPVFGKVISGMDVVNSICTTPTTNDRPNTPVQMVSITVLD